MFEGEELTPEVIAEYMETPEGALELQRRLAALKVDSQMDQGLALELGEETLGASPNIPGATRGLLPGASGINPGKENRRRMLQQLMQNQGLW